MPSYSTTPLFSIQEMANDNQSPRIYEDRSGRGLTGSCTKVSKEYVRPTPVNNSLSRFKSHISSFDGSEEVYREELRVLLSVIESFDPRYDSYFDSSIQEEDPRTTAHRKQRNDFLHSLVKKIFHSHQNLAKILTCSNDLGLVLLRFSEWSLKAQPLYTCYLEHYHLNSDASSSETELRMQPIVEIQRLSDFIAVSRKSVFSLGAQPQIRLQDIISNLELASERFLRLTKKTVERSHGEMARTSHNVSFSSVKSFVQLSPVCSSFDLSKIESVFSSELFYKNEKLSTAVHFQTVDLVFFQAPSSNTTMLALVRIEDNSKSLLFPPFRYGELVFCKDVDNFVVLLRHCLSSGVDLYVSLDKKHPERSTQARCKLLEMFPSRNPTPSGRYIPQGANGLGVSLPMKENAPPNGLQYIPPRKPNSNIQRQYRQSCTQTDPHSSVISRPVVSSSSTLTNSTTSSVSTANNVPIAGTFAAHLAKKQSILRKASNTTKSTSSRSSSINASSLEHPADSVQSAPNVQAPDIKLENACGKKDEDDDTLHGKDNSIDEVDAHSDINPGDTLSFTLDPKDNAEKEKQHEEKEQFDEERHSTHSVDLTNDKYSDNACNVLKEVMDDESSSGETPQISSPEMPYEEQQPRREKASSIASSNNDIPQESHQPSSESRDESADEGDDVTDLQQPKSLSREEESTSSSNTFSLSKTMFDPEAFAKTYEDALLDAVDFDSKPKAHKFGFFSHLFGKKRHSNKLRSTFKSSASEGSIATSEGKSFKGVKTDEDEKYLLLLKSIVASPDQFYLQDVKYSVWGENGWSEAQLVKLKWVHSENRERYIAGYLLDAGKDSNESDSNSVAFLLLFGRETFVRRAGAFDVQIRSKNYRGNSVMLLLRASSVVNLHKLLDIFSCDKEAAISNSSSQQTDFSFIANSSSSHTVLSEMAEKDSDPLPPPPKKFNVELNSQSPVSSIGSVSCNSSTSNKSHSSMLRHGDNMVLVYHSLVKLYRLSGKSNKMKSLGNVVLKVADYNSSTEMQYLIRNLKVSIDVDLPNEALTVVDSSKLFLDLSAGGSDNTPNTGSYVLSFGKADDMNDLLNVIGHHDR
ncbi:hypothetical protein BRETT_004918 [Brettanomyces bruxellensis]|uniref:PH-like domain-containing protein n=2 Tax=Dekkera bruxellensis TaxID=5007 RepID=A0A871R668_DEKBR|nr:uncharacterized protein BRETT_004918 [Brettanomyces bruxellensis]QOU20264.1 hypothetical protein BRETT_004918 [Brettanomyces bruxellensis]